MFLTQYEIRAMIKSVRDKINSYLGAQVSSYSEKDRHYLYASDLSQRHKKLQFIVGSHDDHYAGVNLYAMWFDLSKVTKTNLCELIFKLQGILQPIEGLPPAKTSLVRIVEDAINQLNCILDNMMLEDAMNAQLDDDAQAGSIFSLKV